jgi:hypothetical protein
MNNGLKIRNQRIRIIVSELEIFLPSQIAADQTTNDQDWSTRPNFKTQATLNSSTKLGYNIVCPRSTLYSTDTVDPSTNPSRILTSRSFLQWSVG